MKNVRKIAVGLGVASLLVVGWVAPQSSAESASPTGYTVISSEGVCDLATLDLVTGTLTDLPAASSSDACAIDLAAAPDGTVYGIGGDNFSGGGPLGTNLAQAAEAGVLVTYAADGTAGTKPIVVEDGTAGRTVVGGIAVSPSGTLYVHLVVDQVGCDTGAPDTTGTTIASPQYVGDSVCLYTLDPGTGMATLVGTTGLFETPFFGITWCGGLNTIALLPPEGPGTWGTESASTGTVTLGPAVQGSGLPLGYDCNSTTGGPLWSLESPNNNLLTAQATEVTISQVDPATGAITTVVAVSDSTADLQALAVVPTVAATPTTTTVAVAQAAAVAPTFTG